MGEQQGLALDGDPSSERQPTDSYTSKTLDRGLRLIEVLAAEHQGLTVSELAQALGIHRAPVYRLVATLAEHRLVKRARDGRYFLGFGLVELAGNVASDLRSAALPELTMLAEDVKATATLSVVDDQEAVAILVVEPRNTRIHVSYRTGTRHPLNTGASGLAILAGRPPEPNERKEIVRARETGYVVTTGDFEEGGAEIAVPVKPGGSLVKVSIGVIGMGSLDESTIAPRVVGAASAIAELLTLLPSTSDPEVTHSGFH